MFTTRMATEIYLIRISPQRIVQMLPQMSTASRTSGKGGNRHNVECKYACLQGHVDSWQSQPTLSEMPAGNVLLSAAILFLGSTYAKVTHLCAIFNLAIMKEQTFHTVQSKYLFPVAQQTWNDYQQDLHRKFRGQPLAVSGDGHCDSPGFNAKYCMYTMAQKTGEILNFRVVQVTEATSSVAMEKEGFKRYVDDLIASGFQFTSLATDRHRGIALLCRTEYHHINHQFDVWHVSKGLMKKLTKASKQKRKQDLSPWTKSICKHLWWSCQTCGGMPLVSRRSGFPFFIIAAMSTLRGFREVYILCSPTTGSREDRWNTMAVAGKHISPSLAVHSSEQNLNQGS